MPEPTGEVVVYRSPDGRAQVQLRATGGTVWLTQGQIADLYATSVPNIVQIVRRILADAEQSEATVNSELVVRQEGSRQVTRELKVYNLDMVLAVGYRVTTPQAMHFRQWATTVLREYLRTGFVLDDERLKDPASTDYFDELIARIRDIRASERRFYQKVRDLFAATSADYDGTTETAKQFFATIQNKLLHAVTGQAAADLILARADADAPAMGLTSWKRDRVARADVVVSKNYLTEAEITELNRLTTMFLDFAEDRALRRVTTVMVDWLDQTDRFLTFNERSVLTGAGTTSHDRMVEQVRARYDDFDARRRVVESRLAEDEELGDLSALTALEREAPPDA